MKLFIVPIVCAFFLLPSISLHAAEPTPVELQNVGITEHLGEGLPLDLPFVDDGGNPVTLRGYLAQGKPMLLALAYYGCPNLCGLLLNGTADVLSKLAFRAGEDFQFATVSIDPTETPQLAAEKKANYKATEWHFLTGREAEIQKLAAAVGFGFSYDDDQKQYAHAAALMVITPEGKLSRYLYGIQFEPRDLKLALLEASEGKIGNIVDRLLLYCYHYDPKGRKYALVATNLMKGGGLLTVMAIGAVVAGLSRRKRSQKEKDERC